MTNRQLKAYMTIGVKDQKTLSLLWKQLRKDLSC